jgi:hypothetical protein
MNTFDSFLPSLHLFIEYLLCATCTRAIIQGLGQVRKDCREDSRAKLWQCNSLNLAIAGEMERYVRGRVPRAFGLTGSGPREREGERLAQKSQLWGARHDL